MSDLEGKVTAITGGASGIGLALAELLISKGCFVSVAVPTAEPSITQS